MNNKIAVFTLTALTLMSCDRDIELALSTESFTEMDLEMCINTKCPEITINYVEAVGDTEVSAKINNRIKDFILSSLLMGEDSIPRAKTIEEAAKFFIEAYNADKAQFPDMAGEYFAEITVHQIYTSTDLWCFELGQYLYTGGAHGYGTTSFLNIDPETGQKIATTDLFKNEVDFTAFAEKKFRMQQNIPSGQAINESGYWFEGDIFQLPESVGFTQDSIIFVYNQYDIASYADGPIEVKIALDEAKPYLTHQ